MRSQGYLGKEGLSELLCGLGGWGQREQQSSILSILLMYYNSNMEMHPSNGRLYSLNAA